MTLTITFSKTRKVNLDKWFFLGLAFIVIAVPVATSTIPGSPAWKLSQGVPSNIVFDIFSLCVGWFLIYSVIRTKTGP